MKGKIVLVLIVLLLAVWWFGMAPPDYLQVRGPILFDDKAVQAAAEVDQSGKFADQLEVLPSDLPGHDDIIFLHQGQQAIVSGMDGQIWSYDFRTRQAARFTDPPLMAAGMHESPNNENQIYFCASHLWGDSYPTGERVGLYRLNLTTKDIVPIVLDVPDTNFSSPKVWGLDDPDAPRLSADGKGLASRPLAFCNDLEMSEDGNRIYFSEPFSYEGASMGGGTVHEVLAYNGNGRIWQHDLTTGETRLVVEGFHFLDGILYDLHPDSDQEQSILSSLTAGFRIMRFYVSGPKTGIAEMVQDGLPGMCDGMDRDKQGNIWCGLFTQRSRTLTWLHENPWLKQVLLRLPIYSMSQPKNTGVLVLTPDASKPLYYASYEGPKSSQIASAIPGPDGWIYITPFSREHRGLVRFPNPLN